MKYSVCAVSRKPFPALTFSSFDVSRISSVRSCREQYDLATSRAVARLNVLAELCLPYVRVGGRFLAMKGALAREEVDEAAHGIEKLGGQVAEIYEYPVAGTVHKAVVIEKRRPTPPQYPRAFAKIKKSPL